MTKFHDRFSNLGAPRKIWTVSAIRGQRARLAAVHEKLIKNFRPGDRLVYTGNYFCATEGAEPLAVIDDILAFRRRLMAQPGVMAEDIIYLRGVQEELWTKLTQVQLAQSPRQIFEWIAETAPEMDALLSVYGTSLFEAGRVAREGILSLTRWTGALKNKMRAQPGAEKFLTSLRRAAFTENAESNDNNLLFVHAGINPGKPLTEQNDQFWWAHKSFDTMTQPYLPFRTVIRGADPKGGGIQIGSVAISLDGGSGKGGSLVCAEVSPLGDVIDYFAA